MVTICRGKSSATGSVCCNRKEMITGFVLRDFRNNGSPARLPTSLTKMAIMSFANDEHQWRQGQKRAKSFVMNVIPAAN